MGHIQCHGKYFIFFPGELWHVLAVVVTGMAFFVLLLSGFLMAYRRLSKMKAGKHLGAKVLTTFFFFLLHFLIWFCSG